MHAIHVPYADGWLKRFQAGTGLNWEDIIVVGLSHGSTTAARFAQQKKLDRVLCFSGPRDQDQSWQALRSARPRRSIRTANSRRSDGPLDGRADHASPEAITRMVLPRPAPPSASCSNTRR